jgi:MFS transporter, ACS family, allantoate permease
MADVEKNDVALTTNTDDGRRAPSHIDIQARHGSLTSTKEARRILKHSHDADEAMKAFANGEIVEVSEADNKQLLRVIDHHLLPIMCVV